MRTLGLIYLIAYSLDFFLSLMATLNTSLEAVSDALSLLVIGFTLVVFILAIIKSMKPEKLFIVLSSYYLLMVAFGFVTGILLVLKVGPSGVLQANNHMMEFMRMQFSWYSPAVWTMLGLWFCATIYGWVGFSRQPSAEFQK